MNSHKTIALVTLFTLFAGCAEVEPQSGRDRQAIRSAVQAQAPEVRACYEEHLEGAPEAEGRVVVRFTISPSGAVSDSAIEVDELASAELEGCLLNAISGLRFEAIDGDEETTVSYPFIFRPRAEEAVPSRVEQLDRETIRQVFTNARGGYQRCYEAGLEETPELEGQVNVHLTIQEDGAVSELSLEGSTLADDAVNACLEAHLATLRFPAHQGGPVEVTYPLVFRSSR